MTLTPCQQHPNRYTQPGDAETWLGATWARNACHTSCPRPIDECAREALSAGTLLYADPVTHPIVASGGIWAGIQCRGDAATHQALTAIAYPDGDAPEATTSACAVCTRPFRTEEDENVVGIDSVHRATPNSPLCRGCYSTARRTGNLRPLRTPVPETCNACGRAMGRKHGQVRHHTAGNCINCVRTGKVGAAA
ncbi:hypothetical protein GS982_20000 [Rhodococcus hoagii]|nr:hypothetical protein [Prescottella equi]